MKKGRKRVRWILFTEMLILLAGLGFLGYMMYGKIKTKTSPEEVLTAYMEHIEKQEYEEMYALLEPENAKETGKKNFLTRNQNIYEAIEIQNLQIKNIEVREKKGKTICVSYETSLKTIAGEINFPNEAQMVKTKKGYRIIWDDSMIFPDLGSADKVRVSTQKAKRGEIQDRNGHVLAGEGTVSSVGIIPGKLEDREASLEKIGELLEMDVETIQDKLEAGWVKEDSFVPVKLLPKIEETDLMKMEPEEKILAEKNRQEQLLTIPGVMISDTQQRTYSLGEAAAHLIGYVQSVTAEDLEEHEGEDYSSGDVIGRNGMEGLYETELKGQDGHEITIVNEEGELKKVLAVDGKRDGENIQLTIDASVQMALYEQFKEDKSFSVAMNPYTGEVLALVSTPSYDNNEFIMGMSEAKWTSLNEDEKKPLYNRFRQTWCPGSTFKPVVAAIGLKSGAVNPEEDYGNVGKRWQKDESWGSYFVTTLKAYEPVTLENAIIYSDNIYFAKAALKICAQEMKNSLKELGFNEKLPFEIEMTESQYSNTEEIETEIQLADSGYGQGQILMNPLHIASVYTAFCNQGNMIQPYLRYKDEPQAEVWIAEAFPQEVAERVLNSLVKVINQSDGTGYRAHREDILLAGKTGTAEIKVSQEDTSGTELGWFAVFTAEADTEKPILIVSMAEDVKEIGGSGYVVKKDKNVLDAYLN